MARNMKLLGILLLLSLVTGSCSAQTVVEVFDKFDVKITLNGDSAHIRETITIKNVIDKPIVPGYAYTTLKTSSQKNVMGIPISGKKTGPVDISNVVVTFDGNQISDVLVTRTNESTDIRYGLWFPISPGESRTVVVEYDSPGFVDKGILFTQGYYPIDANIPINGAEITLELPDGSHVTYSNSRPSRSNHIAVWTREHVGTDDWLLKYEYSSIPLPTLPIRWSVMLWIMMLGIVSAWSYSYWKPQK